MIKIHKYKVTEEYEHRCSACGRILALHQYENLYIINMDHATVKLCSKCKKTLARKLHNYDR